jgi:CRP-like cAMP-binding protein
MSSNLLKELDAIAISAHVESESRVFRNGDPGSALYVVRSGKIALIWEGPGQVYPLVTAGPGAIIGLPAS